VYISFEFSNGAANDSIVDVFGLLYKTGKQRLVTNGVDQPRNAAAIAKNAPKRGLCEIRRAIGAGQSKPVLDVLGDLGARERRQMVPHRDALAKLAQTRMIQAIAQFRLAQQNDLQEFPVVQFNV
jgi:hypothetical protein